MKTNKLLGLLTALVLLVSVAGCAPAYYGNRYGSYHGRHHHPYAARPVPPRPYGGYGHSGW
jgi:hypothetical protein